MSTRKNVSDMVRDIADNDTEYTIERDGKPVAIVVPYDRLMRLRQAVQQLTDPPPPWRG